MSDTTDLNHDIDLRPDIDLNHDIDLRPDIDLNHDIDLRPNPGPAAPIELVWLPPDDHDRNRDLARGWLAEVEQSQAEQRHPRQRQSFVAGRLAAKAAVRRHLTDRGFRELDPRRIVVSNDPRGCPGVTVRGARLATRGLRVSIAHSAGLGAALAATVRPDPTADRPVDQTGPGVDVERISDRAPSFERAVLAPAERALAPVDQDDRDTWLTRLWSVKEAAAKATGLGLQGRPKSFAVDGVDGTRMRVAARWYRSQVVSVAGERFVVAWTDQP
jgi:phosphopantetheinyl transferase